MILDEAGERGYNRTSALFLKLFFLQQILLFLSVIRTVSIRIIRFICVHIIFEFYQTNLCNSRNSRSKQSTVHLFKFA